MIQGVWGARGKSFEHLVPLVEALVKSGNQVTSDGFGDDKNGHFISMRDPIDGRVVDGTPFHLKEETRFWAQDDTVTCYHCGTRIYGGRVTELVKQHPMQRRIVELGAEGKPYAHLVAVADWLIRQGNKAEGPFREQDGVAILQMRDPLDPANVRSVAYGGGTIRFDGASRITCSHCGGEIRGG